MADVLDALRECLAPHYDIERLIGAGGVARVFRAAEQSPHRRVAIKVIDPELSNRLLRERFIREVDLSSKLSHPHIVPIFAGGEDRYDVRVAELRREIHFADEALAQQTVAQLRVDDLDRDPAVRALLGGPEDARHTAGADQALDVVVRGEAFA